MRAGDLDSKPTFAFDAFDLANRLIEEDKGPTRPEDFGAYHFLHDKPLGIGSLGDVWLAEERGELAAGRVVAVKLLHRVADKSLAANEVQSQSRLLNRYIATLYNHGLLEDGTPWIAMEFVDGQPLDEYCELHHCSIAERLRVFHAVCEAVAYAHGEKIDHGDLKPSNILVKSNGEPKLLDFGLARRFHSASTASEAQPVLGLTPAYAAPEQFLGESAGFRTDVYSLGVVLYELLTGELPLDPAQHTLVEFVKLKTSAQKPASLSIAARRGNGCAANLCRELSRGQLRDLDAMCQKAMAVDVKERYTSVEALLGDLDRFLNWQPLQARLPHSWAYTCGKFVRRYRRGVVAACLTTLFVAGGVGSYTFELAKARNAALAEAARTQRVKQFFLDAFDHAAEDALPADKSRIISLFLDRGTKDARFLGQDPAMQADIFQGFGTMYEKWGELDRAERILREAVRIDEMHGPKVAPQAVRARLALGMLLADRGAYDEAIAIGNEVLRIPVAGSDYRAAMRLIADANIYLGHLALADSLYEKVLALDKQRHEQGKPEVADDLMNLGNVELDRGNYVGAESYFRQALAMNRSWYGKDSPQAGDSASYVAQALYFQGGHEAEESELLNYALSALEKAHGEQDIRVAFTLAQKGALAIELNNLDEAEADFTRAASIYRSIRGDEHQTVAIQLANVASVYLVEKQYGRAEQLFRHVIKRFEKILPADNLQIGIARMKLGRCLLGEKRYADSELELREGYDILTKQTGPGASWLQTTRENLVTVYNALNQPEKASKIQAELDRGQIASRGTR